MNENSSVAESELKQKPSAKPNIIMFVFLLYFLFVPRMLLDVLYLGEFSLYADVMLVRFVNWGIPVLIYISYIVLTKRKVLASLYFKRLSLKNVMYISVISLAIATTFNLFVAGSAFLFSDEPMQFFQLPIPVWLAIFDMAIVIGIYEEIVFRGVFWHNYDSNGCIGFWKIALVTGLFFGLVHHSLFQITHTTVSGILLFAPLLYFTRSIWAPILLHAIWNAVPSNPQFFVNTQAEFEAALPVYLIVMAVIAIVMMPLAIICGKKFYAESKHNIETGTDLSGKSNTFIVTYWLLIVSMIAVIFFRI